MHYIFNGDWPCLAGVPARSPSVRQLFSYPFRVFFLSLTVLAILAVPLWITLVTGSISLPLAMPALHWHQHEMLFGFLSAGIAGFLLTAVCVWTGTERTHGTRLLLLWLVWLAGRILLAAGGQLPELLVQAVNLAFLPLVMLDAGWRIRRARQLRQVMLLVILGLLWLMQVGFVTTLDTRFSHGALVMAMALIGVIGGRITPAFSANWLRQRGMDSSAVRVVPRLDMASLASLIALMAALVAGTDLLSGLLALIAGALLWCVWHGKAGVSLRAPALDSAPVDPLGAGRPAAGRHPAGRLARYGLESRCRHRCHRLSDPRVIARSPWAIPAGPWCCPAAWLPPLY